MSQVVNINDTKLPIEELHLSFLTHKLRNELSKGLEKENMIAEQDKKLLYKLYLKIKEEFKNLDKSNL